MDLFEIQLYSASLGSPVFLSAGSGLGVWTDIDTTFGGGSWNFLYSSDTPGTTNIDVRFRIRNKQTQVFQDQLVALVSYNLLGGTPPPTSTPVGTPPNTPPGTPPNTPPPPASQTPAVTVTPTDTPQPLPLNGGNYQLNGFKSGQGTINNYLRFNSDGTITRQTLQFPYNFNDTFPAMWLNTTPIDPTDYWIRAVIITENYVSGNRTGIFGTFQQMPASGFLSWGNLCTYNASNGAGEAWTRFTIEIALDAAGLTTFDTAIGVVNSIVT